MKGFKNSTRTQSGHGYDEVPTRPATSKDVAAAKAVRIITPGKSTPRVTDSMILGKSEDKAPGERGGKKFAVGGPVEYVGKDTNKIDRSSPKVTVAQIKKDFESGTKLSELANRAQGSEAAARFVDAIRADIKEKGWDSPYAWVSKSEGKRPTLPSRKSMYGEADRDNSAAQKASTSDFKARDVRKRDDIRFEEATLPSRGMKRMPADDKPKRFAVGGPVASGGMPALGKPLTNRNANDARVRPMPVASKAPLIAPKYRPSSADAQAYRARLAAQGDSQPIKSVGTPPAPARPTSAQMAAVPTTKAYKKGGKVVEKGSGEVYASKAAMKKHEASESKAKERSEHAGYAKGGKSRWC